MRGRTFRTVATAAAGAVLGAGLLVGPVQAQPAPPVQSATQTTSCADRTVNPRRPIPAKMFGRCVVRGMKAGRTVTVTTNHDGEVSKGPMRFTKVTDASVTYADSSRVVILGDDAWWKEAGHGWAKAKAKGTQRERQAYLIFVLWRANSSAQAYRSMLASSSTPWEWTGKARKVNGVRAREYTGTPAYAETTFSTYRVWLDNSYRPVRIKTVGTAYGITVKTTQDFRRWGKKVTITAPKVS
ncbi:MAG: hypothetical protein ACI379_13075 [Nocardioides sp.]|uniref:hypothetical protein n=1 Tax=Nocardioides sp. TaxID=35761 RepID=UPI003F02F571